ncbi:hypothetical protein DESA109040_21435 [Deinococcus saxicola]
MDIGGRGDPFLGVDQFWLACGPLICGPPICPVVAFLSAAARAVTNTDGRQAQREPAAGCAAGCQLAAHLKLDLGAGGVLAYLAALADFLPQLLGGGAALGRHAGAQVVPAQQVTVLGVAVGDPARAVADLQDVRDGVQHAPVAPLAAHDGLFGAHALADVAHHFQQAQALAARILHGAALGLAGKDAAVGAAVRRGQGLKGLAFFQPRVQVQRRERLTDQGGSRVPELPFQGAVDQPDLPLRASKGGGVLHGLEDRLELGAGLLLLRLRPPQRDVQGLGAAAGQHLRTHQQVGQSGHQQARQHDQHRHASGGVLAETAGGGVGQGPRLPGQRECDAVLKVTGLNGPCQRLIVQPDTDREAVFQPGWPQSAQKLISAHRQNQKALRRPCLGGPPHRQRQQEAGQGPPQLIFLHQFGAPAGL